MQGTTWPLPHHLSRRECLSLAGNRGPQPQSPQSEKAQSRAAAAGHSPAGETKHMTKGPPGQGGKKRLGFGQLSICSWLKATRKNLVRCRKNKLLSVLGLRRRSTTFCVAKKQTYICSSVKATLKNCLVAKDKNKNFHLFLGLPAMLNDRPCRKKNNNGPSKPKVSRRSAPASLVAPLHGEPPAEASRTGLRVRRAWREVATGCHDWQVLVLKLQVLHDDVQWSL